MAGDDIYGGTSRLLSAVVPLQGIEVTNVDHTDIDAYRAAFRPGKTKLVLLESPTNPRMQARLVSACFAGATQVSRKVCGVSRAESPHARRSHRLVAAATPPRQTAQTCVSRRWLTRGARASAP